MVSVKCSSVSMVYNGKQHISSYKRIKADRISVVVVKMFHRNIMFYGIVWIVLWCMGTDTDVKMPSCCSHQQHQSELDSYSD